MDAKKSKDEAAPEPPRGLVDYQLVFCDTECRFTDFFEMSPNIPLQQFVGKRGDEVIDDEGQRLLTEVRRRVIATGKAESIPMVALKGFETPHLTYQVMVVPCKSHGAVTVIGGVKKEFEAEKAQELESRVGELNELRWATQRLEQSDAFCEALPAVDALVVACDAECRFTNFLNMSRNVPLQKFAGKRGDEVINDEGQRLLTEVRRRVIATGKAESIPMVALKGFETPQIANYQVRVVPRKRDEKIIGTTSLMLDVTELKMAQDDVAEKAREMESRVEELGKLKSDLQRTNLELQRAMSEHDTDDVYAVFEALPAVDAHVELCDTNCRFTGFFKVSASASPHIDLQTLVGKRGDEVIDDEGQRLLTEVRRRVIETGEAESIPMIALKSIEKPHLAYYQVRVVPRKRDGKIIGAVTLMIDVTQKKKAQDEIAEKTRELERRVEELQKLNVELQRATQAKTEFLAMMSHEIRTPMNGVMATAELLATTPPGPEHKEMVNMMVRSASALLQIVNSVLDISKIEAGKLEIEKVQFDIREVVKDAVANIRQNVKINGNLIHYSIGADVPSTAIGDGGRLRQILLNLLSNACKFTKDGTITVSVSRASSEVPSSENILFSVKDTGIGIHPQVVDKLFRPFVQADCSTTRLYGGTGLGLAICKRLAEAMGGSIGVRSTVGQGSEFFVTLPFTIPCPSPGSPIPSTPCSLAISPTGEATANPPSLASTCGEFAAEMLALKKIPDRKSPPPAFFSPAIVQHARERTRILVAEDNAVNQKVLRRLLEKEGWQSDCVDNGQAAVDAVRLYPNRYGVILMDCMMPIMDGAAASQAIRLLESEQPTRMRSFIVAVTADAVSDARRRYLAAGMDEYITKPISAESLRRVLTIYASHQ